MPINKHPVSMCVTLIHTSSLFLWTGDFARAQGLIEQLIALPDDTRWDLSVRLALC
jgi:hypothetical protein